jgi:mannose-1-phosphate guanylyltransferase
MFFWRVSSLLAGLAAHMPELATAAGGMREAIAARAGRERLRALFAPLIDVSIDVGLMERAANVYVTRATFPWDDVGAWDALARTRGADAAGNVASDGAVLIDSRDCIVYDDAGAKGMAIAVIGMEDVIVATTPDGVLVCPRSRAQDVRKAVAALRARGRERFT